MSLNSLAPALVPGLLVMGLLVGGLSGQAPEDPYAGATTERQQLKVFGKAYKGSDVSALADAISELSSVSRRLEDGGGSKAIAKALARGLDSDHLEVRGAALSALAWGRDNDTVLDLIEEELDDLYNDISKLVSRPDEESRAQRRDTSRLYAEVCKIAAWHKDDRSVDVLAKQLRKVTRAGRASDSMAAHTLRPLSEALVELGSRDAVEAVVAKTRTFVGARQKVHARKLHASLAMMSDALGRAPPDFDDKYDQVWHDWFDKYGDRLPKKLGRLELPTEEPPYVKPKKRGARDLDPTGPRRP